MIFCQLETGGTLSRFTGLWTGECSKGVPFVCGYGRGLGPQEDLAHAAECSRTITNKQSTIEVIHSAGYKTKIFGAPNYFLGANI